MLAWPWRTQAGKGIVLTSTSKTERKVLERITNKQWCCCLTLGFARVVLCWQLNHNENKTACIVPDVSILILYVQRKEGRHQWLMKWPL
eukprot:5333447-Amphidinium_carterae.1